MQLCALSSFCEMRGNFRFLRYFAYFQLIVVYIGLLHTFIHPTVCVSYKLRLNVSVRVQIVSVHKSVRIPTLC